MHISSELVWMLLLLPLAGQAATLQQQHQQGVPPQQTISDDRCDAAFDVRTDFLKRGGKEPQLLPEFRAVLETCNKERAAQKKWKEKQ